MPHRSLSSPRAHDVEVAVIGAGPFGLSVAAHLKHAGVSTLVFGEPLAFWRHNMPKGMKLRSPWGATKISSPDRSLSFTAYAAAQALERGRPLPLEDFLAYGEWFQQRAVPDVDRRTVRLVEAAGNGFRLTLAAGEILTADRVVIATGLLNQDYRPQPFRGLPATLVSHSSEHADFAPFRGKHVGVIGRGQSACESAVLLAEAGAEVELISRGEVHWLGAPAAEPKTAAWWLAEALEPPSAVGPFPLNWFAEWPALARRLPARWRDEFARRCLKAGAAGWLKPRFNNVQCNPGRSITAARMVGDGVVLELDRGTKTFDHVVLGTGYRIDLSRLPILAPQLLAKIARAGGSPLLGARFESSVPKLHFVGAYAVKSHGPLMRFIAGAPFAARSVTRAARTRLVPKSEIEQPAAAFGAAADPAPPR
jgi:glycine/D-amino acid oxidase-like deaminating enzyme